MQIEGLHRLIGEVTEVQFYFIYISIMVVLTILFFWGRRKPLLPSQLKMTASAGSQEPLLQASNSKKSVLPSHESPCLFMFNGHSWDAYEVLGVHREASMADVKKAFEAAIQNSHQSSHEFLKAALACMLTSMKDRGFKP